MPRFFVPASDISGDQATLRGTEFRHLHRVLRLREGDEVTIFDDQGSEYAGFIVSLSPRVAVARVTNSYTPARESPLAITLCQAIPKGRKMDLVIEKATELGVNTVVPFTSAFSLGAPPGGIKHQRWQKIALAAAKQSGRTSVPAIASPMTFQEALVGTADHDLKLVFFESETMSLLADVPDSSEAAASAALIVGGEGGFSREEITTAREAGFLVVGLGPRILRAETAALIVVALVQARWGDLGKR